ncbi:MAG: exodeoxyribonuclease VII small subunit [Luteolibacter sp.]|jgi:exodeoxyribonuclease VII small subunit|nr:exodeoxyribonuclease VII small subunit [Luteolibacter sp.]
MARKKSDREENSTTPSFEEALAGLEAIIEAMEHEQLPLEDLVAYYENGSTLLDRCEAILQSARGRIELITLRNKTEIQGEAADFSPPSGQPDASDDDDDDDIRLF